MAETISVVMPIIAKGLAGVFGVIILIWLSIALLSKIVK